MLKLIHSQIRLLVVLCVDGPETLTVTDCPGSQSSLHDREWAESTVSPASWLFTEVGRVVVMETVGGRMPIQTEQRCGGSMWDGNALLTTAVLLSALMKKI